MLIAFSILFISIITSVTWIYPIYQVFSITQAKPIITSISGDGSKIAFHSNMDGDYEVFVVNSDGTGLTQLTDNQATDRDASISGDGSKIAFDSDVDGDSEIFVVNIDGTGLTQLTNNTTTDWLASINGDGTKIAYSGSFGGEPGSGDFFVVNSDVAGLTQLTPCSPHSYPSISGDGSKIAFDGWGKGGWKIFVFNSDGTGLTQLTQDMVIDDYHASISGDGSKVACHSYDYMDGDCEIFVVNSDGTGLTQLTDNQATDVYPSISSDGTKIAYTSDVNGDYEIFVSINGVSMPLPTPENEYSFPIRYAITGILAVIVAVALVVIFFVRKKINLKRGES